MLRAVESLFINPEIEITEPRLFNLKFLSGSAGTTTTNNNLNQSSNNGSPIGNPNMSFQPMTTQSLAIRQTANVGYAVKRVSGNDFSTFVASENSLWVMGSKKYGYNKSQSPFYLKLIDKVKVKGLATGRNHSLFWDSAGKLYSWGFAHHGKLGHPLRPNQEENLEFLPQKVDFFNDKFVGEAAVSDSYSLAITTSGDLYFWGKVMPSRVHGYEQGNSGNKSKETANVMEQARPKLILPPKGISNLVNPFFCRVKSGRSHSAVLSSSAVLYMIGSNFEGCLGLYEMSDKDQPFPIEEIKNERIIDVACGDKFTIAILGDKDQDPRKFKYINQMKSNKMKVVKNMSCNVIQKMQSPEKATSFSQEFLNQLAAKKLGLSLKDIPEVFKKKDSYASADGSINGLKKLSEFEQYLGMLHALWIEAQGTNVDVEREVLEEVLKEDSRLSAREILEQIHEKVARIKENEQNRKKITQKINQMAQNEEMKGENAKIVAQNNKKRATTSNGQNVKNFRISSASQRDLQVSTFTNVAKKTDQEEQAELFETFINLRYVDSQDKKEEFKKMVLELEDLKRRDIDSKATKHVRRNQKKKAQKRNFFATQSTELNKRIVQTQAEREKAYNQKMLHLKNSLYEKSVEYKEIQKKIQEKRGKFNLWCIEWVNYLNMERLSRFLFDKIKVVREEKLFRIRKKIAVRSLTFFFRKIRVTRKLSRMPIQHISLLRELAKMCKLKFEHSKRVWAMETVSKNFIFNELFRKTRMKIKVKRQDLKIISGFMRFALLKYMNMSRKLMVKWDNYIIEISNSISNDDLQTQFQNVVRTVKTMGPWADSDFHSYEEYFIKQQQQKKKGFLTGKTQLENNSENFGGSSANKGTDSVNKSVLRLVQNAPIKLTTLIERQSFKFTSLESKGISSHKEIKNNLLKSNPLVIGASGEALSNRTKESEGRTGVHPPELTDNAIFGSRIESQQMKKISPVSNSSPAPGGRRFLPFGHGPNSGFAKDYSSPEQYRFELRERSLLPFSKHREFVKLPSIYTFQVENLQIFKVILDKITTLEIQTKKKVIQKIIHMIFQNFKKDQEEYNTALKVFVQQNKKVIMIEKTKAMLNTDPEDLKQLQRKLNEDKAMLTKSKQHNWGGKQKRNGVLSIEAEDDYGFIIMKIVKSMKDSPKQPVLKVDYSKETFKQLMEIYFREMRSIILEQIHQAKKNNSK